MNIKLYTKLHLFFFILFKWVFLPNQKEFPFLDTFKSEIFFRRYKHILLKYNPSILDFVEIICIFLDIKLKKLLSYQFSEPKWLNSHQSRKPYWIRDFFFLSSFFFFKQTLAKKSAKWLR